MAWAFDVTSNIPRIKQTGTDTNLAGIATAIAAVPTVARSTAYTVAQMVKPPAANGMWYRCSTAGTTSGTAPLYNPVSGGTITDGTVVFTAFLAPDVRTLGTTNHYYMPDFRFSIEGTLTNSNPQQENFTCWDLLLPAVASNFTSGAWASDGVTPRWDGLHFCATRVGSNNADNGSGGLQLQNGQFTFIGGEIQVAGAIGFTAGTTPRSYYTRWRNTKEWGASSSRIRAYTNTAIFRDCEFFDIAYDLFRMPAEFSVKARGSEYLAQYVGSQAGGADAKFTASNLENVDGTYDFDNYFSGWVELYNCKAGAALKVVSQYPNSTFWARHCVPLFQDLVITAKNTAGAAVEDVRFTATESPTNSPTVTISTVGNLKTWDFRTPLSYQTTTNASGVATSSPVLNVWYWQTSFKQSLRFPASTAVYEGRAYGYKSTTVSVVLGASAAIPVSAGMISRDTATVLTRAAALAQTGITFAASGATGGTVTISANETLQDVWDYYNAWIIEFANRPSNDTWTCVAGNMSMGAWNLVVNSGVTLSGSGNVTSFSTTGSVTNNGAITTVYTSSAGTSSILTLKNVTAAGVAAIWHPGTTATELFQANNTASATDYTLYYPPGSVGLVKNYARELYGSQRVAGSITLAAGLNTVTFVDIPDVGITQPVQATVAAYTAIETASKFYDRTAVFRLSEQGIKLGQLVTRSGTSLEIGTFSHLVNQNAAAVYSVLGSTITTKSTSYAGDSKYSTEIATPPATITAATTEVITIAREDANGNSQVTIQAAGVSTFEIWKITDATNPDNYATGTLLATVGIGTWRFISANGFKLVIRDTTTNFRVVTEMEKGIYTAELFFGASVQLAQAAEVSEINTKVNILQVSLESMQGTAFDTATDSLHAVRTAIDTKPTAAQTATAVWTAAERTLTSAGSSGATLAEIEGSAVLAKVNTAMTLAAAYDAAKTAATQSSVDAVATDIDTLATSVDTLDQLVQDLPTLTEIEATAVLAKTTDVTAVPGAVRTELATELARIDANISSRSTLTAQDIPQGLTAEQVWTHATRTLTETPGLTTGQADQLRKMAQLHGIGATLVVTETTRTAGDVSQTITSTEAQTTVSAA
jgi:hypothetical protein